MFSFFSKTQPPACAISTITANGLTVHKGLSKVSKGPFGYHHKALPLRPIVTTSVVPKGFQTHLSAHFGPPKGLVRRTLSSLKNTTQTAVLPGVLVFLNETWFFVRVFCGDLSDVVPYFVRLADEAGRPVDPAIRPYLLDQEVPTPDSTLGSTLSIQLQRGSIDLSGAASLFTQRAASPYPANYVAAHLNCQETKNALVRLTSSAAAEDFFKLDLPSCFSTLPAATLATSISSKTISKNLVSCLPPVTQEWKQTSFRCYEALADQVLKSLESSTALTVDDLVSETGSLYRILKRELLDKVHSNCTAESQRLTELIDSISHISATAKGLFTDLTCIGNVYKKGEQRSVLLPRLKRCLAQLDMLETYFDQVMRETKSALAEKRNKTLAAHIKECQRINKMVFKRHFDLTESRPQFEGSYVKVKSRAAYRKTLSELNSFLASVTDLYLPKQVRRAERKAKKARKLIRSAKASATKLLELCQ